MQLVPYSDLSQMAQTIAKSGLFGVKSADQALALMLISQAEGISPALAARDYHVIQGRPTLKSDAMVARFQAAGGKIEWRDYTEQSVSALFTHPQGGSVEVKWTIDMAKRAGLTGKDVWRQYPRAMLRARVVSEGIRTVYPGVCVGVYTPEEVEQFDAKPAEYQQYHVTSTADPVSALPQSVTNNMEVVTQDAEVVTSADPIGDYLEPISKEATEYLRFLGRISGEDSWRDMPSETETLILANPDRFVRQAKQHALTQESK
jgi:hypothetical protein